MFSLHDKTIQEQIPKISEEPKEQMGISPHGNQQSKVGWRMAVSNRACGDTGGKKQKGRHRLVTKISTGSPSQKSMNRHNTMMQSSSGTVTNLPEGQRSAGDSQVSCRCAELLLQQVTMAGAKGAAGAGGAEWKL